MYFPTRIIVTVGPLLSHNEWKVSADQPSTDASQQRIQRDLLCLTGINQFVKLVKWLMFLFKIFEAHKLAVVNEKIYSTKIYLEVLEKQE